MANLFIDYLYARDERFAADFGLQECVPFSTGIGDVIAANAHVAGWWVITGANSGIGLQLAAILDNAGKKLVLIDRQTDVLEQRFARHRVLRMDLSDEQQVRSGVETLRGLRVFRLVNNAGVGFRGTLMQLPFESVRAMIDVNIRAPLLLTKLLWEDLSATGGTVVNITSSVAYGPLPFMSIYAASKAFMLHWSEALRYEARPSVRVVTVTPSGTRTNFQRSAGVHDGGSGLLDPEMVARKILAAVDAGKPVKIVNPATRVMHLLARLVPRSIMTELWGRMFERYR